MQLRYKVVLLAVVPLVVTAGLLVFVVEREGSALANRQVAEVEPILISAKEEELRHLMVLAQKAVPEFDELHRNDQETCEPEALERLRGLSFGDDGYFYAYDLDSAKNLMNARNPELEGRNQWSLTDDTGQPVMQPLITKARAGGGFARYRWPRPSRHTWSPKLGYVVPVGRCMLGTGLYLDDVEETKRHIRASYSAAIGHTMLSVAVIAVLVVVVVATLGVALNVSQRRLADAKLRKLTWQVVAAQEAERARVARYLHDEAVQDLIAVKCDLETTLIELTSDPPCGKLTERLKQGLAGLATGVEQIRTISRDLRPPLQGDRLPALLAQIGAAFSARTGVAAAVAAPATGQALSSEAATALLRVTQQALDNVERHARASRVAIQLAACSRGGSSGLRVTVRDDGCGFDVAAVELRRGGGIGLLNMRERIEALGGRLALRSGPDGTEIEAFLPGELSLEVRPGV